MPIYDMANKGYTDKTEHHRTIMNCLIGSGIMESSNQKQIKQKVRAMLTTHLRLLLSMDELIDNRDTDWTPVQAGKSLRQRLPEHRQNVEVSIATEDLKAGKMMCRIKMESGEQDINSTEICLLNIRCWMMETAPIHLSNYNIGLGAAGTRTPYQKRKAYEYSRKVIRDCKNDGGITYVDGSIHSSASYLAQYGGAGIIRLDSMGVLESAFMGQIETKDAQQAELSAIEHALRLMRDGDIQAQEREHILCDCKNAVNYVQGSYQTPWKYVKTVQRIKELQLRLKSRKITVTTHWIPGHVDTKGNEIADTAAKAAAALWLGKNTHYGTHQTPKQLQIIHKNILI